MLLCRKKERKAVIPFFFHALFFLVDTWCIHYPRCNLQQKKKSSFKLPASNRYERWILHQFNNSRDFSFINFVVFSPHAHRLKWNQQVDRSHGCTDFGISSKMCLCFYVAKILWRQENERHAPPITVIDCVCACVCLCVCVCVCACVSGGQVNALVSSPVLHIHMYICNIIIYYILCTVTAQHFAWMILHFTCFA